MKTKIIFLAAIFFYATCMSGNCFGQEYFTKNGRISFFSKASLENISADNNQVISLLNMQTGALRFYVLINAFHFPKAMMEQHFNSDYLESDKYAKSTFKGIIAGINNVDLEKDGSYAVDVSGSLEIHGVSKNIKTSGTINVKNGKLSATSVFKIILKDYQVAIPSIVVNNISEQIEISVSCQYEKK